MKSSLLVVCASLFIVNTGKGESEENNKFRPKSAREAMRYASRIAAKQNAKELASTERSVLVERVEEKEETTQVEEDFNAVKKTPKDGFSKFEDDGNWYRTPQERQEAFKLARMKKIKVMRKLRAKMLHDGSDEMQVGSAQKDDKWRKSLKEMKGKERLQRKRNRLKKRRPRRSAEDNKEDESLYKNDFESLRENFKKNFLKDETKGHPEKEVTQNFEWAKRMGITISTVRVFLDEKHDDVKYIVLKPPPTNWPRPQFNFYQHKNPRYRKGMYTRFTRPTRYYATIPPRHLRRTAGSRNERDQLRPPQEIYIKKEKMSLPTVPKRSQVKSNKKLDLSSSEEEISEKSLEDSTELPSVKQVTVRPATGSIRTATVIQKQSAADQGSRYHAASTSSDYTYNPRNYNSYYQRPNYRHYNFDHNYNYVAEQPRKVITQVQKKLILRSEFRNELISTTSKSEEVLTTPLVTWPTIHRKKGFEFATEPQYDTPWPNVGINPELKEKSIKSWMSRREDWGRRDMWRIDPGHEVPLPPSVTDTSRGGPGMWRQDDYIPNYFADDQQRPYWRQPRGGWARGRGRPYRGRRHYRGDQHATMYNEATGWGSNSSVPHRKENVIRPAAVPSSVQMGIEMARQWNKLSDPFLHTTVSGQNVIVTPVGNLEEVPLNIRQPRTPFSNLRLLQPTKKLYESQTTIIHDTTQVQMTSRPWASRPLTDDGSSMLRPSYMMTSSRPRPPPDDGLSMLRPSYMMTSRPRPPPDDGASMIRPSYIVTTIIPKADYRSSMLRPSYMVMTTRTPRASDHSFMFRPSYMITTSTPRSSDHSSMLQPSYMVTTRIPASSDGFSMLRPSYMQMTDLPRPPQFSSVHRPNYGMRPGGHSRSSVGSSMLRPSYMDAETGEDRLDFKKNDTETGGSGKTYDETGHAFTTYRRYFVRTKRQRMGRRKYKYMRRQQYKDRKQKSIEVFRFGNETVEEGITEDFQKLQMEYLGIGRKAQNIRRKITTAVPKEDNDFQGGYNRQHKQLLEEESLSSVESVQVVEKLHGQRLKTKQEPIVMAEPYMPHSLMSESEEEPKINERHGYRAQVTFPPVEPRTTTKKQTGGKKAKMKRGKKTKNKATFKYMKPVGDIKWEAYNSESDNYDKVPTFSKMKSDEAPMVEIGSDSSSTLMTIEPDTDINILKKLKLEQAKKDFHYKNFRKELSGLSLNNKYAVTGRKKLWNLSSAVQRLAKLRDTRRQKHRVDRLTRILNYKIGEETNKNKVDRISLYYQIK